MDSLRYRWVGQIKPNSAVFISSVASFVSFASTSSFLFLRTAVARACPHLVRRCPKITELMPGCVSIHVRHGDKSKEMKLQAWERYLAHSEEMVRESQSDQSPLRRCAFLSTEDPNVVKESRSPKTTRLGWDVRACQEPGRTNAGIKGLEKQVRNL